MKFRLSVIFEGTVPDQIYSCIFEESSSYSGVIKTSGTIAINVKTP